MKKVVLATVFALTTVTATHAITAEQVMNNRNLALTALGVADFYKHNCMGLTHRGDQLVKAVFNRYSFHRVDIVELMNTKEFRNGYNASAVYRSCNKLRSALTDAGVGPLIR